MLFRVQSILTKIDNEVSKEYIVMNYWNSRKRANIQIRWHNGAEKQLQLLVTHKLVFMINKIFELFIVLLNKISGTFTTTLALPHPFHHAASSNAP